MRFRHPGSAIPSAAPDKTDAAVSDAGDQLLAFLERAALDGHTVTPITVAGSILSSRSLRLEAALRDLGSEGRAVVTAPTAELIGLRRLVDAERAIAQAVVARTAAGTLWLVCGAASADREAAVDEVGGAHPAVLDDAERVDAETFATFFATCADDETVVLAGDLDELDSAGAGRVFADIVHSGVAAVRQVKPASGSSVDVQSVVIDQLVAAVRGGEFVVPDDPSRQVVVLNVASAAEAAHRVEQLIATSIPRALGIVATDIHLLGVLESDIDGLQRLASITGTDSPSTVLTTAGRSYPAVVLVLNPDCSGVVTRQLIYSGIRQAGKHLSIVNATGSALADAVRREPARLRRTLLRQLIAEMRAS